MTNPVIAVDIGGTHLRAAQVSGEGNIMGKVQCVRSDFSTLTGGSSSAALTAIGDALAKAIAPLTHGVDAIGIGFPGYITDGVVMGSPNIPALQQVPLAHDLSDRLHKRVVVDNDANCAAFGEWRFGAGQGEPSLLHLTLGTGVGGGYVCQGKIFSGDCAMALEMGHLRVDWGVEARVCGCGGKGCLEQYASATAVARIFSQRCGKGCDAAQVCRYADDGDPAALAVYAQAGAVLGGGIAQAVKLLDVRAVTISGGMIGAWDYFYPNLQQALTANLLPPQRRNVTVRASTLNDQAGLLGAAALALAL